jgi:hypothetical protein
MVLEGRGGPEISREAFAEPMSPTAGLLDDKKWKSSTGSEHSTHENSFSPTIFRDAVKQLEHRECEQESITRSERETAQAMHSSLSILEIFESLETRVTFSRSVGLSRLIPLACAGGLGEFSPPVSSGGANARDLRQNV